VTGRTIRLPGDQGRSIGGTRSEDTRPCASADPSGSSSPVGAHKADLFVDSLPDAPSPRSCIPPRRSVTRGNPLRWSGRLTPSTARYYIDTAFQDVNREACVLMAEKLRSRGVSCELPHQPGSHAGILDGAAWRSTCGSTPGSPVEAARKGRQPQGWSDPVPPRVSCELGRPSSSLLH